MDRWQPNELSKSHYAVHDHTAVELIVKRADAEQEQMGLTLRRRCKEKVPKKASGFLHHLENGRALWGLMIRGKKDSEEVGKLA